MTDQIQNELQPIQPLPPEPASPSFNTSRNIIAAIILTVLIAFGAGYLYYISRSSSQPSSSNQNTDTLDTTEYLYKDGDFKIIKPDLWRVSANPSLFSTLFFDNINKALEIKTERLGSVLSEEYGCYLKISQASTGGDFLGKVARFKEMLLANRSSQLLEEKTSIDSGSPVFFSFLFEDIGFKINFWIYPVGDKMDILAIFAWSKNFDQFCKNFSDNVPSLVKISGDVGKK